MTQTRQRKKSSLTAHKPHHCVKVHCSCPMPSRHPTWYTNGLCERHFFEMNISANNDADLNSSQISKTLSEEKEMHPINHQHQPLRDDVRATREIFDGRQWQIIEQKIDRGSRATSKSSTVQLERQEIIDLLFDDDALALKPVKDTIENELLQVFQFIKNYQTIKDGLKKHEQQNN